MSVKWPVLLGLLTVFTNCCPRKTHLSTDTRDSVRIVTVVQTREIIRMDTVTIRLPLQEKSHTVPDSASHLENDYASSDAWIEADGSLYHDLKTKPGDQKIAIETKDRETVRIDTVRLIQQQTNTIEVAAPLTPWQARWMTLGKIFAGILAALLVGGVLKIARKIKVG